MGAWLGLLRRYGRIFAAAWKARGRVRHAGLTRDEAEFLPAALEVQEKPPHPLARLTVWLIVIFFVLAALWAVFGRVDVVAVARGKIIPDSRVKIVQAARGGTVRRILVRDGSAVNAGDPLIVLDPTVSDAEYAQLLEDWNGARLEAEAARLLAEAAEAKQPPDFSHSPNLWEIDRRRVHRRQELLKAAHGEHRARLEQADGELAVLERRLQTERRQTKRVRGLIEQEKQSLARRLATGADEIRRLERLLPMTRERHQSRKMLYNEGAVSRMEFLDAEERMVAAEHDLARQQNLLEERKAESARRLLELEREAELHEGRTAELEAEIRRLRQTRRLTVSAFRREALARREEALRRAAAQEQELVKLRRQRQDNHILAPIGGVVERLEIHTEGGVLTDAQPLMVIVPADRVLAAEVFVENKDIGFVQVGQRAEIKVDAFPYTKYGLVDSEVADLSDDAIEDQQRGLVYRARLKLREDAVEVDGRLVPLAPGMSVAAEIKTGERRVIEFFLTPLLQYKSESLSER